MANLVNAINHAKLMFYIFKLTVIYVAWQNIKIKYITKKRYERNEKNIHTCIALYDLQCLFLQRLIYLFNNV